MSLLSKQISNLFNGVSQQTAALRLPSQAELQENAMSDPIDGLHKRAPSEFIARIISGSLNKPHIHTMVRDKKEKYQSVLANGSLQVFDLNGVERRVNFPNGKDYLLSQDPRTDFQALTVADYTFFVNRKIRPAAAVSPYKTTDQVSLTVNFGQGVVQAAGLNPLRTDGRFFYVYESGYTTAGNPEGYQIGVGEGSNRGWFSHADAMAAAIKSMRTLGTVSTYEDEPLITNVAGNPSYMEPLYTTGVSMAGVVITNKVPITMVQEGINGGKARDPHLRIVYKRFDETTLPVIKPDVGWPANKFYIPGSVRTSHVVGITDGSLFVSVNGKTFEKIAEPTWSAEDYLGYFTPLIAAAFPALTVEAAGWQLRIKAPAGQQVFVSAWDSNQRGYVKCIYSELVHQEAVYIVIKNGVPEQTYSVSLNSQKFSITTGDTNSPATYKADTVATNLAALINGPNTGFQAAVYGHFIEVIRADKVLMTFASHDTYNDTAMSAYKNRVSAVEELPNKFIPGRPIQIVGADGSAGFYVHYTVKSSTSVKAYGLDSQVKIVRPLSLVEPAGNTWNTVEGSEVGLWEECAQPGAPDVLIPATMPHVLVSEADGSFTFKVIDWFKRTCGDEDSVPTPSFVGKNIEDILFHKNRLAFMTAETVVFSRAGQFFNFWAVTARDVLDGDPIDYQVNHTKVSTLRHSAVFNNSIMLFSDNTQFILSSNGPLTPKTVSIMPATEFDCSTTCRPITVGHTVHFLAEKDNWASVWEYYVQSRGIYNSADNITAHLPKYIPAGVFKMASSTTIDFMCALSDATPDTLYVQKYLWADGKEEKIQNSWSKWKLTGTILNVDMVETTIVLTVQRADGIYLESINTQSGREDRALGFQVHLDRKVLVSGSYDAENTATNFVLPYPVLQGLVGVNAESGAKLTLSITGTHSVRVSGRVQDAYFGDVYKMRYRFSPIFMRGDKEAILDSTLQILTFTMNYEKTLDFNIEVSPLARPMHTHTFSAWKLGAVGHQLGVLTPVSGKFRVPVMGEGKTTPIEITSSSHLPCYFQSAVWEGNYVLRTRRT